MSSYCINNSIIHNNSFDCVRQCSECYCYEQGLFLAKYLVPVTQEDADYYWEQSYRFWYVSTHGMPKQWRET